MSIRIVVFLSFIIGVFSCTNNRQQNEEFERVEGCSGIVNEYDITTRLPEWFIEAGVLNNRTVNNVYQVQSDLNPFYFEEDFNNDGHRDIAVSVLNIEDGKRGFLIYHSVLNEVNILGAGKIFKNCLSDDFSYINIWKINRDEELDAGVGEDEPISIQGPSIQIIKEESIGGQIYWDGTEYVYFHQSC